MRGNQCLGEEQATLGAASGWRTATLVGAERVEHVREIGIVEARTRVTDVNFDAPPFNG
jgi:hypothetical protein